VSLSHRPTKQNRWKTTSHPLAVSIVYSASREHSPCDNRIAANVILQTQKYNILILTTVHNSWTSDNQITEIIPFTLFEIQRKIWHHRLQETMQGHTCKSIPRSHFSRGRMNGENIMWHPPVGSNIVGLSRQYWPTNDSFCCVLCAARSSQIPTSKEGKGKGKDGREKWRGPPLMFEILKKHLATHVKGIPQLDIWYRWVGGWEWTGEWPDLVEVAVAWKGEASAAEQGSHERSQCVEHQHRSRVAFVYTHSSQPATRNQSIITRYTLEMQPSNDTLT